VEYCYRWCCCFVLEVNEMRGVVMKVFVVGVMGVFGRVFVL